jgi:hypothetical protein
MYNPDTASDSVLQITSIEITSRIIILLGLKYERFISARISHIEDKLN